MKQWLPDMRAASINQRNARSILAAEAVAKLGCQFEPCGPATDDDDVAKGIIHSLTALKLRLSRS